MKMQRNIIGIFAVLLFFLFLSCGKNRPGVINASVTQFGGSVAVNGKVIDSPGYLLAYDDLVSTGEKSFCDIIINEKNILKLGANTVFRFRISGEENIIELEQGWIAGVTKKKFTKQGKYLIKTPTTIAAVRGTFFCFKVEDSNNSYFCVCNGKIEFMEDGKTSGESVESAHHAAMRYTQKDDGSISVDKNPGLLYHDDEGLEKLAKAINVKVDWTKPDSE
jgi:ribosomal protein S4